MTVPALDERTVRLAGHRVEAGAVQLDKGAGRQLGAPGSQSGGGHGLQRQSLMPLEEALMRVSLERLQTFLVIVHGLEVGIDILCGKISMDRSKPLTQKISALRSWNARRPN
jgi:hypothetical protein